MLFFTVLLLCSGSAFGVKYNRTIKQPPNLEKLEGSTDAVAAKPYYAYIQNYDSDDDITTYLGNGVVVAEYYVVSTSLIYDIVSSPYDVTVIAGALVPLDPENEGERRTGREFFYHPDCDKSTDATKMKNCIALLRVCPAFSTDFIVPALVQDLSAYRDPTRLVTLFQYQNDVLVFADINIGEYCECNRIEGFDTEYHVCLANDDDVWGEEEDRITGIMITDYDETEVLGILVKEELYDGNGEVVLSFKPYLPWINDNSIEDPTVY